MKNLYVLFVLHVHYMCSHCMFVSFNASAGEHKRGKRSKSIGSINKNTLLLVHFYEIVVIKLKFCSNYLSYS